MLVTNQEKKNKTPGLNAAKVHSNHKAASGSVEIQIKGKGRDIPVILIVMTKKSNSILKVIALVNHDVVQQATAKDQVRKLLQIWPPHGMVQYPPCSFQSCKGNLHHHTGAHVLVVEVILNAGHATHIKWVGRDKPRSKGVTLVSNDILSQGKPLQEFKIFSKTPRKRLRSIECQNACWRKRGNA